MSVTDLGHGRFLVDRDGRTTIVYVAGPAGRRWAFVNGHVLHEQALLPDPPAHRPGKGGGRQEITAPMPATVLQVLVEPGSAVARGDTLVIIEAMKMEMPLRATEDGVVKTVRCRAGELVQPDTVLVELE